MHEEDGKLSERWRAHCEVTPSHEHDDSRCSRDNSNASSFGHETYPLGMSGLRVSELCLGAITFGDPRPFGSSAEESRAILDGFASAGGTFIDTANLYGEGASERLVGDFIKADRDNFVISTEVHAISKRWLCRSPATAERT